MKESPYKKCSPQVCAHHLMLKGFRFETLSKNLLNDFLDCIDENRGNATIDTAKEIWFNAMYKLLEPRLNEERLIFQDLLKRQASGIDGDYGMEGTI